MGGIEKVYGRLCQKVEEKWIPSYLQAPSDSVHPQEMEEDASVKRRGNQTNTQAEGVEEGRQETGEAVQEGHLAQGGQPGLRTTDS